MSWNPAKDDARITSRLVIANATFKSLNEPVILCPSTVVVAESIVNDATVSVDINITVVVVSAADIYTHTNRNGFTNVVGCTANSRTVRMNIFAVIIRVMMTTPAPAGPGFGFAEPSVNIYLVLAGRRSRWVATTFLAVAFCREVPAPRSCRCQH